MSKLNIQRIRDDFSKAANTYDAAAVVQEEICARALERLQMLKLQANTILDIGSGTGISVRGLKTLFPQSQIIASDIALPMLQQSHNSLSVCGDAAYLPIKSASVDLIFSTSTFQWCEDLSEVFSECSRVLKKEGALLFTTFGPDTLKELRESWSQLDQLDHVHSFIDMHHIGDMLLAQQLADPVVDREMIVIEYQKLRQLLMDLKNTGSRAKFTNEDRNSIGLLGKTKYKHLRAAYEKFRQENDSLPASYEVIYGYARKLLTTQSNSTGEVRIPVDTLKM